MGCFAVTDVSLILKTEDLLEKNFAGYWRNHRNYYNMADDMARHRSTSSFTNPTVLRLHSVMMIEAE